jgi:hypothetical protein
MGLAAAPSRAALPSQTQRVAVEEEEVVQESVEMPAGKSNK